jgi:hypothetical protein
MKKAHADLTIILDYGYVEPAEAEAENNRILAHVGGTITTHLAVSEEGHVTIAVSAPWRSDLVLYVRQYLGDLSELAPFIVQEKLRPGHEI